jgi:hypothetical protein
MAADLVTNINWPGSGSAISGSTPFGIYDTDSIFQSDGPRVADWVAKRLGYPVQNVELLPENIYACFEESINEYGAQVNQFNIRNNLSNLMGQSTGSNFTNNYVEGTNMGSLIKIANAYGQEAEVGGYTTQKTGSILTTIGVSKYDLNHLWADVSESGKRIEVKKVYYENTPAISRFFDPYAVSARGTLNLLDEFGFSSFSPAAQFVMMPIYEDLLRIQAIEFNDQVRRSAYSFNIVNNQLHIFPIPTEKTPANIWFDYVVVEDRDTNSIQKKPGTVSSYSNVNYDTIPYRTINSVGKQWIWKYTLALSKELLGAIREKYGTIPIPEGEVSLDGAALRAEAQNDKDRLYEQLRQNLEELSRPKQMEYKMQEAENVQKMLNKIPMPFYIG